jgi:large subunit ribosomal protein L4
VANVSVYNKDGQEIGSIDLLDDIFAIEVNEYVVHMAVVQYLANQRQGNKSAKTRAEVRGGGRKPWKQKGTGRARQGSIRSPQWTGGGVVFAPKPRDFSFKLNKKVKRLALKSVLSSKVLENKFVVVDDLNMATIKTKDMKKVLNNVKVENALIVLGDSDKNAVLSARNLEGIKTASVGTINVYDILKYEKFVVTKEAVEKMQEVYA